MTSSRHNSDAAQQPGASDQALLDAAREAILAVGWRRTTLTDVARRAGVSRMTLYRRYPDMAALLAELLVREWGPLVDDALVATGEDGGGATARSLARAVARTVTALREDPLFRRIVELDPELLLPYLLQRRGRNQDHILSVLTRALRTGQAHGAVRPGDPGQMSRILLLALQGFVLSSATVPETPPEIVDRELAVLVERYLQP